MWTPRRVVLLVVGFAIFLSGYLVYASYLGRIDGLPPLPEAYWREPDNEPIQEIGPRPPNIIVQKLQLAFGPDCPETKRPIKLEVPSRGLVLAAQDFIIQREDGRVKLSPLSIIIYGKAVGEDRTVEINTVRCDVGYLTFERPITTVTDMGKHRIVAGEIAGNIEIVNNRRTLARDDDLIVTMSKGPLYYNQPQQRIWSDDFVTLLDTQSRPEPTRISGKGLDIDLLAEQPANDPNHPVVRKKPVENITGVKTLTLRSSVDMHLYVDGKSGFLDSTPKTQSQPQPPPEARKTEKAHVIIKCQGPFKYDMLKDFARFDIPAPNPAQPSRFPEQVTVARCQEQGKFDQLVCEHLELQFRKREEHGPARPSTPPSGTGGAARTPPGRRPTNSSESSVNLQIETAHATGRHVTLASDNEVLEAHGNDFFYDARTRMSTLKGTPEVPMWALKEGNHIQAEELQIQDSGDGNHRACARGVGMLRLFDKTTGKRPVEATWKKEMVWTKDGKLDVMHLVGQAVLKDNNAESKQDLQAEDLKIWLETKDTPKTGKNAPSNDPSGENSPSQSRRPHHLIATGKVRSNSREIIIHDTERLVIWFREGIVTAKPGSLVPSGPPTVAGPAPSPNGLPQPKPAPGGAPGVGSAPGGLLGQNPSGQQAAQPIDLSARSVEAHVVRMGEKSELEKLKSEGAVRVIQAPRKKDEKGVDIKGETLQLTHSLDGNVLVVTGDEKELAQLAMDRIVILGPEVNIDQTTNKAWVNGCGAMTMESDTDFQGKKLQKPAPLTIHWDQSMYFNGQFAEFHGGQQGGVQADQATARLACQSMQVFFDRPISLKEGDKESQHARVRNLVCDRAARVEDSVKEKGEWIKYSLLEGSAIAYDNEEATVQASGPGQVRLLQRGGVTPENPTTATAPAPRNPNATPEDNEPKLTYVSYFKRMYANNKNRTARFYMNVRVLHLPGKDPQRAIDLEKVLEKPLPAGAMYLRCDQLKVLTRPGPGDKSYQEMEAVGRVSVQAQDFSGSASVVTYNEEKDQVIFDGGPGGVATLYKIKPGGGPHDRIEGEKIIYSRKTGQHTGVHIRSIIGQ